MLNLKLQNRIVLFQTLGKIFTSQYDSTIQKWFEAFFEIQKCE